MSKQLSPCPFCGSPDVMSDEMSNSRGVGIKGFVECLADGCGCIMFGMTEKQAIRRWEFRKREQILKDRLSNAHNTMLKAFKKYDLEIAKFCHKINMLTGSKE